MQQTNILLLNTDMCQIKKNKTIGLIKNVSLLQSVARISLHFFIIYILSACKYSRINILTNSKYNVPICYQVIGLFPLRTNLMEFYTINSEITKKISYLFYKIKINYKCDSEHQSEDATSRPYIFMYIFTFFRCLEQITQRVFRCQQFL